MNSDDITKAILKVPPYTRYYIAGVILFTFLLSYPIIQIAPYIILDYDLSLKKFQIWRLFSNFLIAGKFSFFFIFYILMTYNVWKDFEDTAILNKKYSDFTMMLMYVMMFLLLLNYFVLDKIFLSMELLFSLLYIDSKRSPDKPVSLYGFKMKSRFIINI